MTSLASAGLDTSDYLEQIESAFAITIPDDDAVSIETLGQLCDYVQERVNAQDGGAQIWHTILNLTSRPTSAFRLPSSHRVLGLSTTSAARLMPANQSLQQHAISHLLDIVK